MTIYGNRDFDDGTSRQVEAAPAAKAAPVTPASSTRAFGTPDVRRVVLRLNGDEPIVVGRAEGRENAVKVAREMVQHIEQAATRSEWPLVDERFIRPGAIVSVDVQRAE